MKCSLFSAGGGTEKAEEKTWYKGWGQQPTQPESYAKYEIHTQATTAGTETSHHCVIP